MKTQAKTKTARENANHPEFGSERMLRAETPRRVAGAGSQERLQRARESVGREGSSYGGRVLRFEKAREGNRTGSVQGLSTEKWDACEQRPSTAR